MTQQDEGSLDLDEILDKFSIFGRYHRTLMLLVIIAFATNSTYCGNYIFAAEAVSYRCASGNFVNETDCGVNSSKYCTEWVYDNPNSFVAEYNLACQEWKRTLVGSMHSFGYMLGLLLIGPLSDRLGRKKMLVITGVLGGIIGLVRSFSPWYWLYVTLEFLEAAIGDICSPMYVLMIEQVATKKRVAYTVLCGLGFSSGNLITAIIASQIRYWRTFLRVIYTPALLFISYYFLLDESPRWLLSKGRKEEAIKIIENAAKTNNIKLDQSTLERIHYVKEKSVSYGILLKNTFASKELLLRFLVCVTWWTVSSFVNYGLAINSVSLPGNKYLNYALFSLMQVPGYMIILVVLQKFNRKLPLIFSFSLGALVCMAQPFVNTNLAWLSITLFMVGELALTMYFKVTYIFTLELFPTYTRNSMHALCSSLGRIGSIVAPQTPLLMRYWSGLPAFVFGVASLVGAAATVLVPDTAHNVLPDTVRQAEEMGMKNIADTNATKL